jgi:DNA repair exonuclease SbcCD ATPase subunit
MRIDHAIAGWMQDLLTDIRRVSNRILTDAARKRTERIEELERHAAQLEGHVAHLNQELESARKALDHARELEVVASQRAHLLNEKDEELAVVREAATKRSLRIQELENARLEDADRHRVDIQDLELRLQISPESGNAELNELPNSPLEELFEKHGLTALSRAVKARRVLLQRRPQRRADKPHGNDIRQ